MTEMLWIRSYPEGVDYFAEFTAEPLYALLDGSIERFADRNLIDFMGRKFTFAEVGTMVAHAARGFQDLGVKKGVKVGLFLPNCPQFIVAYYGILKAGGTVVNYSPLYSAPELLHQIEDSHTDIMVTLSLKALYPKMATMLRESRVKKLVVGTLQEVLPFPKSLLFPLFKGKEIAKVPNDTAHLSFAELMHNNGDYEPVEIDPEEDIAVLQYTGGTTGVSKGAMLSHAALFINTNQMVAWDPEARFGEERTMGVLPFFHVFAMTVVMNYSIRIGAEIVMHPRFELEAVLKDIEKKKPTIMPGVPTMYTAINNYPRTAEMDLSSLRVCISGGAPLPLEVKQKFEALTGASLVEGYGLTETSPVATANPFKGVSKEGSIGLPLPATKIIITDREDPTKVLPQGEDGEICIEGPQLMKGYFGREEATRETIVHGRLRTGDVGYMDENGYTFIIDRMKDMILCSGFNVYPRHVEEVIYQHPAVEEVTVIGVPDEYRGEAPKAFVKLKAGEEALTTAELLEFLSDKLARHAIPREIEFRDELPKTMVGKLSKKELVQEEREKYEKAKGTAKVS